MGAFIVAGVVAFATLAIAILMPPEKSSQSTLTIGMILAALIAASHWLPHIGW